jgi:multidrug efflux pump
MMLSDISIRRPVLATMMNLALVLFGLVALPRLPVRELPDIDPPIVNVQTVYPGANAEVVETEVTEKLEEAINSIEGIKTLTSESREQLSSITIEFDLSREIEAAAQDVRDRVSRVRGTLPEDIDEPVVAKQDADAQPMLWVALFSDRYSTLELTDVAENVMKDQLQTIRGVSSIFIGGGKRFAMRIRLDADRMAAHRVTVLDVENALRRQNVELPSGFVENLDREMTIQTLGELKTAEQFNDLVIREDNATFVRLKDIGVAEVGAEDERSRARFNSRPSVGLGIVKQSKANTIEVAKGIKAELERLMPLLPPGIETAIPYDESVYVEASIHEVWETLFIAFLLVVITIFIFLRNVRSTIIPCLSIPVSIVATFFVLSLMGYSVNILTMLALVLAIGIVVDDSIVVLENIYRHIEEGLPPFEAALKGMREIGFAVVAVTLSLVAVFIPLAFQTTVTGRLFIEFAIALCGSVLISAFVALTLTPMAAARVLKPHTATRHGSLFNWFERRFDHFAEHYSRLLHWSLTHRRTLVAGSFVLFALTGLLYMHLAKEFLPQEDKGRLLCISIGPEGATAEYTGRMVDKMEQIASQTPEVEGYFSAVALSRGGPGKGNEGLMFVRLKDERERHVTDIVEGPGGMGMRFFTEIEGALSFPIIPKAIGFTFSQPLQLVIQNQDIDELYAQTMTVANKLRQAGWAMNVRSTFELNKPELRIDIDRNRAAALGVSVEDISRTLQILFGGLDLSKIKVGGKEYDVIAQLRREARLTPSDLESLYVRNDRGELIQVNNVVTYRTGAGPNAIPHYNRYRSSTIEATPVGMPIGEAVQKTQDLLKEDVASGLRFTWAGEAEDLQETGRGFNFVMILGCIVVFMVLASQFESLLHPFTIMLTLPLAAFGALGGLWIMEQVNALGTMLHGWANYAPNPPAIAKILSAAIPRVPAMSINLFSQVGMVLLLGLATKNSILLVEFANQQRNQGKSALDAMLEAGRIRFRPILMTSFSTILGILPIAIGMGAGAESRRPMGVAAVGGLLTTTFLTLLVVPVAYTLFSDWGSRMRRWRHKPATIAMLALALLPFLAGTGRAETSTHTAAPASTNHTYDLNRCLATALEWNFDIRKARERIRRQEGVEVAVRSRLVPNLRAYGQYEQIDDGRIQQFGPQESNPENWNVDVEVVQTLYSGGGNRAAYRSEKQRVEAAIQELQTVINDTMLLVRERYLDVLLARLQVKVQELNVQLLEEELQQEKNKLEVGAVSPFNVLRAEVELANGQTPLIRTRNAYNIAIQELARIMGLSGDDLEADDPDLVIEGDLTFQPFEISLGQALKTAMENRPELKQYRNIVLAQQEALRATRSTYRPSVSAFAGYGANNDQFSDDLWDELHGWDFGLRMDWALFDGMQTRGRVMESASALKEAELSRDQIEADISVQVRRAHSSLIEATELVHATQKVVEQAEESLRLARSRFDAGAATQLDVLQAQFSLTEARTNENEALHDYNLVLARLHRAMGVALAVGSM